MSDDVQKPYREGFSFDLEQIETCGKGVNRPRKTNAVVAVGHLPVLVCGCSLAPAAFITANAAFRGRDMVTRLYQIETGTIALKVFTDGASKSLASPSASFDLRPVMGKQAA